MRRFTLQAALFAATLCVGGFASAGTVVAGVGPVTILVLKGGDNAMRIGVSIPGTPVNPAGCNVANAGFALQLNDPGRSAEETRIMINSLQLAFMTKRLVELHIRDDLCHTMDGYPHRVVSSVSVFN